MIALPKPQQFTTRLSYIQKVSSKVYLKRFDLVEPKEMNFVAGQTVMLHIAPGVNRSMSIASPPSEKTSITVAHDVSPMGPYSQWTIQAKVGDQMSFMGPLGIFTLDKQSSRKKIFVATGTGIAPFRAMLFDYFGGGGTAEIVLYWGLRHEEDIFWQREFDQLTQTYPIFHFVLTLSQPQPSWPGLRGRVGDHLFADEKNLAQDEFYLCGSKEMIYQIKDQLLAATVPKEQIKSELFY